MEKRNGQRLIFIFYYYCIILLWGFTLSLHAYLYKRELVSFFNANLVKMQKQQFFPLYEDFSFITDVPDGKYNFPLRSEIARKRE